MTTAMGVAGSSRLVALLGLALAAGCSPRRPDVEAVEATIARYNDLLRDGYQRQNMTWMREVASDEQAEKLYRHMAALGEGNLRLSSTLRDLSFVRVDFPAPGEASIETREVWDFTHHRIATGERFAEEEGFVYRLAYALRKRGDAWIVTGVDVISGESTNAVLPWPTVDRQGNVRHAGSASAAAPRQRGGAFEAATPPQ